MSPSVLVSSANLLTNSFNGFINIFAIKISATGRVHSSTCSTTIISVNLFLSILSFYFPGAFYSLFLFSPGTLIDLCDMSADTGRSNRSVGGGGGLVFLGGGAGGGGGGPPGGGRPGGGGGGGGARPRPQPLMF